jgi:hypothetical protein
MPFAILSPEKLVRVKVVDELLFVGIEMEIPTKSSTQIAQMA